MARGRLEACGALSTPYGAEAAIPASAHAFRSIIRRHAERTGSRHAVKAAIISRLPCPRVPSVTFPCHGFVARGDAAGGAGRRGRSVIRGVAGGQSFVRAAIAIRLQCARGLLAPGAGAQVASRRRTQGNFCLWHRRTCAGACVWA
eukprot:365847-Chlamydomonas_euryale.AAC.36